MLSTRYDVVVAGARCAGASTALLLARLGMRVLVVDPCTRGSDALSTHALMRPGVLQLHRWGLLDAIRAGGTPPVRETTFHYGGAPVTVSIKPRDGVDALYAPRRTLLDTVLADAAAVSGAEMVYGHSVVDLLRSRDGRVRGASIAGPDQDRVEITAALVIGADGLRSGVAQLVGAEFDYVVRHRTAVVYGYWKGLGLDGFNWHYAPGMSVGVIPTNDGDTCVFVAIPPARFEAQRRGGLDALFHDALREASAALAARIAGSNPSGRLRGFAGAPGFLRRSAGPGWALVGDAGYFKDPLTAHGISDALRDAELLARAACEGTDVALAQYQHTRDELVRRLLDVTDRISSFDWDLESVKDHHLELSREMNREVEFLLALGPPPAAAGRRSNGGDRSWEMPASQVLPLGRAESAGDDPTFKEFSGHRN
ncbi:MAG: FAD-dependent monooxygenase [Dehalococcoidia bacterium]|nr:FAD-dependent monooxygenase [Dehalococcoidia bacterium]